MCPWLLVFSTTLSSKHPLSFIDIFKGRRELHSFQVPLRQRQKACEGANYITWLSHLVSEELCRMHPGFTRWKFSFHSSSLIWWLHCSIHEAAVISQKQKLKGRWLKLILPGFHSVYCYGSLWQHASGTRARDNS